MPFNSSSCYNSLTPMKQKIIAITGPIAAGKSEAAEYFKLKGCFVVNADRIGHAVLEKRNISLKLLTVFGEGIFDNKKINRKKLGVIVFSDKKKLAKLNSIVHPEIIKEIEKLIAKFYSVKKNIGKIFVIDAALPPIFKGIARKVILVIASKKIRLERLKKIGLSVDKVKEIFAIQPSDKEYKSIADHVVINNSTDEKFHTKLESIYGII